MTANTSRTPAGPARPGSTGRTYADTLRRRAADIRRDAEAKARGESVVGGVPTGLRAWDERGGLERGILTVVGAGTGDGKSFLKLHIASAAARAGLRALMVDFEDPAARTADRTFSSATLIDNKRLKNLDGITEFELEQIERALGEMSWAERIDHEAGLRTAEACLALMEADPTHPYDLVLVDYAQALPAGPGGMEETLRRFSWEANAVAQRTNAAVVVFSQIRGEVEKRGQDRYERWKTWGKGEGAPDISGFCPTGLTDCAWAKALADQCKTLLYAWLPGRRMHLLGHTNVRNDRMRLVTGKSNFSDAGDLTFRFCGATGVIGDWDGAAATR